MNPFEEEMKEKIRTETLAPKELVDVEERAMRRYRGHRRRKSAKGLLLVVFMLASFLLYTANTESVFAKRLQSVPVLKDLLVVMSFSAQDEEKLEELGLVSDSGTHEVMLQYALSEDKRMYLYFQFPEDLLPEEEDRLYVKMLEVSDQKTGEDFSMTFQEERFIYPPLEKGYVSIMGFIPAGFDLKFPEKLHMSFEAKVLKNTTLGKDGFVAEEEVDLGTFAFDMDLQKMEKRIIENIQGHMDIQGNTFTLEAVERGLRTVDITVSQDEENEEIISHVKGHVRDALTKEILVEDFTTSYLMTTGEINSFYLSGEKLPSEGEVELVVEEAILIPKNQRFVEVDTQKKQLVQEIPSLTLDMVSIGKMSALSFIVEENGTNPFGFFYYTEEGEEKKMPGPSIQSVGEGATKWSYVFEEPLHGIIKISRSTYFGETVQLEEKAVVRFSLPKAHSIAPLP